LILVGSAAASVLLWLAVTATAGQTPTARPFPPYKTPRLAGHADLNGVWQAFVTANWDLQDHEAQAGLVLNSWARTARVLRGKAWWRAARFPINRARSPETWEGGTLIVDVTGYRSGSLQVLQASAARSQAGLMR